MLLVKKMYIDCRFNSSDSASDADFKIDLPTTLLIPEDTSFYIDDVCIPHTWYPIETGMNDLVVFRVNGVNMFVCAPSGNYNVTDLGVAIVQFMNDILASISQEKRIESSQILAFTE